VRCCRFLGKHVTPSVEDGGGGRGVAIFGANLVYVLGLLLQAMTVSWI